MALGLLPPWIVAGSEFSIAAKRLDILQNPTQISHYSEIKSPPIPI
jgi:hypothetical protein